MKTVPLHRKPLVLLGLGGIAVLLWLVRPNDRQPAATPHVAQKATPAPKTESSPSLPTALPEAAVAPLPQETTPMAMDEGNGQPGEISQPRTETQLHSKPGDFAFGQFTNTVFSESLRLADDALAGEDGTFTSGQFLGNSGFDTIIMNYKATVPADASLRFEVRTMSLQGQWSDWQEVDSDHLNTPVELDGKGYGWQYRFVLSAPSTARSPEVRSVAVTTRRSGPMPVARATPVSLQPGVSDVP